MEQTNNAPGEIINALPATQPINAGELTPMAIIGTAIQAGAGVEQLERLFDLQERFEAREAKKAFDKALAAFKAEQPAIMKDSHVKYKSKKTGGFTDYKHATLANILFVIGPLLSAQGLSISWRTNNEGQYVTVTCVLAHNGGHSEETSLTATADTSGNKNALQAIGSTISYLQRYTALAITGITTADMDDDGRTGGGSVTEKPAPQNQQPEKSQPKTPTPDDQRFLQQWIKWAETYKVAPTVDIFDSEVSAKIDPIVDKFHPELWKKMLEKVTEVRTHLTKKMGA